MSYTTGQVRDNARSLVGRLFVLSLRSTSQLSCLSQRKMNIEYVIYHLRASVGKINLFVCHRIPNGNVKAPSWLPKVVRDSEFGRHLCKPEKPPSNLITLRV